MRKGFCGECKLASTQKSLTNERAKKMVGSKNDKFGSYEDLLKDCFLWWLHHGVGLAWLCSIL